MEENALHVFVVVIVAMGMPAVAAVRVLGRMRVAMRMVVMMSVGVIMSMAVRMTMPMVVAGMRVTKREQAHHVDEKAQYTHHEQFLHVAELPALGNAFDSLPRKLEADENQEDAVTETSQRVEFAPTVRPLRRRRPLRGNCSTEANDQTQAVEEHVDGITQQAERTTGPAVNALHKHKSKIQAREIGNSPRILLAQNAVDKRVPLALLY